MNDLYKIREDKTRVISGLSRNKLNFLLIVKKKFIIIQLNSALKNWGVLALEEKKYQKNTINI